MDIDYLKHLFKSLEKSEGQNIETNVLSKPGNFEDKPIIKENVIVNDNSIFLLNIFKFKKKYIDKIHKLNKIYVSLYLDYEQDYNIKKFLLNKKERDTLFFTQDGGQKYNIEIGKTISAYDLTDQEFEFDKNFTSNKHNVLIIGGGPIGLFMAILIKTYMPFLDVKIIEKRNQEGKRKLEREQIVRLNLCSSIENTEETNIKTFFEKIGLNYENIHDCPAGFGFIPKNHWDYNNSIIKISINILEFKLSTIAEEIGISIIQSDMQNIETLISLTTDKTLSIFDATGGRLSFNKPTWTNINAPVRYCSYITGKSNNLKNINITQDVINKNTYFFPRSIGYGFYYGNCNKDQYPEIKSQNIVNEPDKIRSGQFEFTVKGLNTNSVNEINGIPLISIGDSLRSADFTTGSGLNYGFFYCTISALLFKQQYNECFKYSKGGFNNKKGKKTKKKGIKIKKSKHFTLHNRMLCRNYVPFKET